VALSLIGIHPLVQPRRPRRRATRRACAVVVSAGPSPRPSRRRALRGGAPPCRSPREPPRAGHLVRPGPHPLPHLEEVPHAAVRGKPSPDTGEAASADRRAGGDLAERRPYRSSDRRV